MSLGGDIDRLISMLRVAKIKYTLDKENLSWVEANGVRFEFIHTGVKLSAMRPCGHVDEEASDPR